MPSPTMCMCQGVFWSLKETSHENNSFGLLNIQLQLVLPAPGDTVFHQPRVLSLFCLWCRPQWLYCLETSTKTEQETIQSPKLQLSVVQTGPPCGRIAACWFYWFHQEHKSTIICFECENFKKICKDIYFFFFSIMYLLLTSHFTSTSVFCLIKAIMCDH